MKRSRLKLTPEQWMRFVVSPLMGICSYEAIMATTAQHIVDKLVKESGSFPFVLCFVICMVGMAVVIEINIAVSRRLDRFLKWDKQPLRRASVQFLIIAAITAFLSLTGSAIYFMIYKPPDFIQPYISEGVVKNALISAFVALAGAGIYLTLSFFHHWNISQIEAERYKIAAAESQIEALKSQLDPHFLFNSLNTLTELVEVNSSKSLDFLKSFSQVYRYVLQTREHESVTLQEELDFAESYLTLLKTRFGEALQVEKNIAEDDMTRHLPPMTLQLLLENAVKHNQLTKTKPLGIQLSTDGRMLIVQNNLQPKSSKGYSSGIGLKNITERVLRLTQQEPIIENGGEVFTVKIPLQ
ncbi:MAG TPA: histidine kinase [Saprospiraceae bacterium]|nr:histidine kinase [Saprospiraceae bacterium]